MKKTKGYMGGGPVGYREGGRVRRSNSELAPETSPRPMPRSEGVAGQFQRGMNRLLEEEDRTTRPGKAASKPRKFAKGGKVDQMQCSPRKQAAMGGRAK